MKVLIFQEDPTIALLKVHRDTTEILLKVYMQAGFFVSRALIRRKICALVTFLFGHTF